MNQPEGAAALLDELQPGMSVYLPGASGEILALAHALANDPERASGVRFTGCMVPGINETLDYAGLSETAHFTTFMLPAVMAPGFAARRVSLMPLGYCSAARFLSEQSFDVAFAHVARPDEAGNCSLGIASDFAPLVWARAKRKVLVVNPAMPRLPRALSLSADEADAAITLEGPLVEADDRPADDTAKAIAERAAQLVPDHAHVQAGIGGAPGAIWDRLTGHRGLVLRSGLAVPGLVALAEAGALAPGGGHLAGIALGTHDFYSWLAETDLVRFATTLETHDIANLSALPRLVSVNSALEIDLFGQANVEWRGSRLTGGIGGGPDFMRAAAASLGGRSIIALPATAKGGTASRIVARLAYPTASIARSDIDAVVTEYGIAELGHKGLDQRAEALTAVAAPAFRDSVWNEWEALRRAMS